jgi:hypothetical protein
MITPRQLYNGYPSSDLIPLEIPNDGEPFDVYIGRIGKNNIRRCGDSLYAFLLFELSENCENKDDAIRALDIALKDIKSVQAYINSRSES